jgi:hypothetical protein
VVSGGGVRAAVFVTGGGTGIERVLAVAVGRVRAAVFVVEDRTGVEAAFVVKVVLVAGGGIGIYSTLPVNTVNTNPKIRAATPPTRSAMAGTIWLAAKAQITPEAIRIKPRGESTLIAVSVTS